jgi:hypothetical protein
VSQLRIKELSTDASQSYITAEGAVANITMAATILKESPEGNWEYFGTVTTNDFEQMAGLRAWFSTGNSMSEQEFFGV